MYKEIDKYNKIFKSNEFQQDKYKFYIVLKIVKGNNPIIYSNEEDYFIIRSDNNHPVWIWTKNNIDKSLVNEIKDIIELLVINIKDKFICKKEFYELLIEENFKFINKEDYFEMGSLHCIKTKEPRRCDGHMCKANLTDTDILTNYWYLDNHETGDGELTIEKAKEDVKNMINIGNTYVLKNKQNKIVCMSSYTIVNDIARINHVFTPKEERGKAYCANLIYNLSNKLLDEGKTPILYTDYNYIASNKSYINAGYIKDGILIKFSCSKEMVKKCQN